MSSESRIVPSFIILNWMAQPVDTNSRLALKLVLKCASVQDVEHWRVIAWAYQSCHLADFEKTLKDTSEGSYSTFTRPLLVPMSIVKFVLPMPQLSLRFLFLFPSYFRSLKINTLI